MISIPASRVVVSHEENGAFAGGARRDDILARAAALRGLFAGRAAAHDRDADFPFDDIGDFSESGLMALPSRADAGGLGGSLATAQAVVGTLAQGDPSVALVIVNHYMVHATIAARAGWPEALAARLEGENVRQPGLINAALAEPDLGSASYGGLPETVATATADGWQISGRKAYVTGIPALSWLLVRARTDEADPRVGLFLVPARADGVIVHRNWDHIGMRATHSHEVEFRDVAVPAGDVTDLVEGGARHPVLSGMMRWNTGLLGALYDGIVRGGLDWTVGFLRERVPSNLGQPLATLPSVQDAVGRVVLALDENRMLLDLYADDVAAGRAEAADRGAAVIKARVIDGAADLTLHLLSLAGNAGLSARNPLERCHRDALCGRIHAPHGELVRRKAGQRILAP
ncbi:acyl-CoA dehydrogenase family protein [Gluconacetobacter sp. Hr-1-5]|uniref:acyl-CoA dehydrogenase family protein n=1 Tax=Gluconacetobacter sp. Hr-1-5 TaxID=3395370 RepID=UPI003B52650A